MKKRENTRACVFALIVAILSLTCFLYSDETKVLIEEKTFLAPEMVLAPEKIEVKPKTQDYEISQRLENILNATGWFQEPKANVQSGVVFLTGQTKTQQLKDWAELLSHNTQDVVAVVNKMEVVKPSFVNPSIMAHELLKQGTRIVESLPKIIFAIVILLIAYLSARITYRLTVFLFKGKLNISLIHEVLARAISFGILLCGVYFIFDMGELTTLALTIISGTGLLGIVIGIAFRDITENFLASILLSIQNPFSPSDLVEITLPGTTLMLKGYVQRLTARVTILLTVDGKHVQIPNATVYKGTIVNFTSNPLQREDFLIGVDLSGSLSRAVELALDVVVKNEEVLKKPDPLVLVEKIEGSTGYLHIYYWLSKSDNESLKVKSSIIRLIKQSLQKEGFLSGGSLSSEATQTTSEIKSKQDLDEDKVKIMSSKPRLSAKRVDLLNSSKL